jgi:hypothetical protein
MISLYHLTLQLSENYTFCEMLVLVNYDGFRILSNLNHYVLFNVL